MELIEVEKENLYVQFNSKVNDPDTIKTNIFKPPVSRFEDNIDHSDTELDIFHDSAIKQASKNKTVFYAMNFEREMTNLKFKLNPLRVNINPSLNNSEENEGINIPTYHIGSPYSISSMHCKDGNLDAANLLLAGPDSGYKIWLFINPMFSYYLNVLLSLKIKELKEIAKSKTKQHYLSKWETNCPVPLHHKSLVLTTKFLRKYGIMYKIVVQKPGDLIYIHPGVYHQVVNANINMCEAVNVGSVMWNSSALLFVSCMCRDRSVDFVIPNTNKADNEIEVRQKSMSLVCNRCYVCFSDNNAKRKHLCIKESFSCDSCNTSFCRKFSLKRHILNAHVHKTARKIGTHKCRYCLQQFDKDIHQYHQRNCTISDALKAKFTCKKCSKVCRQIEKHVEKCH